MNHASHIFNQSDNREYLVSTILRHIRVQVHFGFSKSLVPLDVRYQSAIFVSSRKRWALLSALDALRPPLFTINLLDIGTPTPQAEFHSLICTLIRGENTHDLLSASLTSEVYLRYGYTCCAMEYWPSLYLKKVTHIFIAKTEIASTFLLVAQELQGALEAFNTH